MIGRLWSWLKGFMFGVVLLSGISGWAFCYFVISIYKCKPAKERPRYQGYQSYSDFRKEKCSKRES